MATATVWAVAGTAVEGWLAWAGGAGGRACRAKACDEAFAKHLWDIRSHKPLPKHAGAGAVAVPEAESQQQAMPAAAPHLLA